ncbi:DUF2283 domain-containing protein [Actinoplanes sp. N902-109]|uniref:DUF2283 domain-containing protein n=1 Tax=Actinoplanes sp. (strain N902-109) TaxID=649831 RepID=UPI0003294953|nr:DUF2283 domain-containing protein [Actinoplanes sp. N902-109]AGL15227.1 hypothetical protein L083_1717 [Actinoplanes sp. N902-109]
MRMTLDPAADAAYVELAGAEHRSVENITVDRPDGMIVLDFDADGHLLGVELLGAQVLLPPDALADADRL